MARTDTLKNFLTDIADKFREKLGITGTISHADYDTKIDEVYEAGYEKGQGESKCNELHLSDLINWNNFFAQNSRHELLSQIAPETTERGTSFINLFSACDKASFTEPPYLIMSNGKSFTSAFQKCPYLVRIPKYDTSNGETFTYFIQECPELQEMPLLNTSKGKAFGYFYKNCKKLKDFPELDTANGENFECMYYGCTSMVNAPGQDTGNGLNFRRMYYGCSSLETIPSLDLGKSTEEDEIFKGCTSLKEVNFVSVNCLANYTTYLDVYDCTQLTHSSLLSLLKALKKTPLESYRPRVRMGETNKAKLTDEELKIATDKGWTVI